MQNHVLSDWKMRIIFLLDANGLSVRVNSTDLIEIELGIGMEAQFQIQMKYSLSRLFTLQ